MTLLNLGTVIPPGAHLLGNGTPVIDRDLLLRAVRESATIVRPGETLLIRLPTGMPEQVYVQYAQQVTAALNQAGVRAILLRADQFAVIDQDAHTIGIRVGGEDEPPGDRPEPDQATIDRAPYEPGQAG